MQPEVYDEFLADHLIFTPDVICQYALQVDTETHVLPCVVGHASCVETSCH